MTPARSGRRILTVNAGSSGAVTTVARHTPREIRRTASARIGRFRPHFRRLTVGIRVALPLAVEIVVKNLVCILLVCVIGLPAALIAQDLAAPAPDAAEPLLTLDNAVSIALAHNRLVQNSGLEVEKTEFEVDAAKTRRLPQFHIDVLGGALLRGIDSTFPAGAFGTYPTIGPIPSEKATIHTPSAFTTFTTAAVDQPILQQYRIGLSVRATRLGRELAEENRRARRQTIAADVRSAYFNLAATQAAVDAAGELVTTLRETQRVTTEYHAQRVVLRAEALEVDARLAKAIYELSIAEHGLATQRERLNQLLGRDLGETFRVEAYPEAHAPDLSLIAARQQAAENRPEIREARVKERQADVDRRLAKAEYIPDLSLSVRYSGVTNVEVLPNHTTVAGFYFTWEPFDWGRKRQTVAAKTRVLAQARNGVTETESQIAVEVGAKYRKWQDAALLLKAARITRAAATEQFRLANNRYHEQAVLIRDVLQAQARTSEADFQLQQALSSFWTALADLHRAMGEE
jgi:outer membrane protein TolC